MPKQIPLNAVQITLCGEAEKLYDEYIGWADGWNGHEINKKKGRNAFSLYKKHRKTCKVCTPLNPEHPLYSKPE